MGRIKNRFANEGWVREAPSGSINGINVTFVLTFTPDDSDGVSLYLDGLMLKKTTHYTISGATITTTAAPNTDQTLFAVYTKQT